MQPTITGEILSPMGVAAVEFIDPREPVAVSMPTPISGVPLFLFADFLQIDF